MNRVTGIGGIFFKAKDPESLREWYRQHLGIKLEAWGGSVMFTNIGEKNPGYQIWSVFPSEDEYFSPGKADFMINYRVDDLKALLAVLKEEGCEVDERIEESEQGLFGWVTDPEGNRVELWEPPV
ncbi:MAG: VOC family protein [Chloroflexi bacterium]|jgi:predicted enzyme related to lactoylglutathione lyase|nr:VOC family protein [Chloroflexota bacterium]